jgi:hypothetical protein
MASMVRTIYCTAVETPAMRDPFAPRPRETFHDLVPWADPYIVALIEKLRRSYADEEDSLPPSRAELQPPLDSDRPDEEDPQSDWWSAAR